MKFYTKHKRAEKKKIKEHIKMRVVFGRLTFDDGKMDGINRQEGRNLGGNSYRTDTQK